MDRVSLKSKSRTARRRARQLAEGVDANRRRFVGQRARGDKAEWLSQPARRYFARYNSPAAK